jgi:ElaB/YqjD/DUF883 family membrane-anchored ribosome-binding protein
MSSSMEDVAVEPRTVDEARDAVERSRQRISSTLDALEGRIVEKKHEIQNRVDVLRPVRDQVERRPFTAVAVAVGVGALLGSIGGRGTEDEERQGRRDGKGRLSEDDRTELREWRRMRRERLQARSRHEHDDDGSSRFDALKNQLAGAVTSAIGAVVTAKVREFTGVTNRGDRR